MSENQETRICLDHVWEQAKQQLENAAREAGIPMVCKTPADFEREMSGIRKTESSRSRKYKDKCLTLLKAFNTLGELAAGGAALAYPPASVCSQALSIVIAIPDRIHKNHETIEAVIGQIHPTFVEFDIFRNLQSHGHISDAMLQCIRAALLAFVEICAACVRSAAKGKLTHFGKHLKSVITNEDPLKAQLDALEGLIKEKDRIMDVSMFAEIVQTGRKAESAYDEAKRARLNTDDFAKSEKKRRDRETWQQNLEVIGVKLCLTRTPQASQTDILEENDKKVSFQSEWYRQLDDYQKWVDNSAESPFLLLAGAKGTGKSFAAASIFFDLTRKGERGLVGFYSFPAMGAKTTSDSHPAQTALKCVVNQLAEKDPLFAIHARRICDGNDLSTATFRDLWSWFILDIGQSNMAFYLIFDGMDNLAEDQRKELLDEFTAIPHAPGMGRSTRILATTSEEIGHVKSSPTFPIVTITSHTGEEMKRYIEREFKRAGLLQEDYEGHLQKKEELCVWLKDQSRGSFQKVQQGLDEIREIVAAEDHDALNRFSTQTNMDTSRLMKAELLKAQESLTAKEIDELNELLTWVEYGKLYFDVEDLKAILYLRTRKLPLGSLEKKIRERYSSFLEISPSGGFLHVVEEMKEVVLKQRTTLRHTLERPTITANISITNASVEVVRRFFWDITSHTWSTPFNFDHEPDLSKLDLKEIRLNEMDSHLLIVKRAFDFLFAEPSPMSKSIGRYLISYLPGHLAVLLVAEGMDAIGHEDKEWIGERINKLFFDKGIVRKHWDSFAAIYWHWQDLEMSYFWSWLKDETATQRIGMRDKEWLEEAKGSSNPNQSLLKRLITEIAQIWLRSQDTTPLPAFQWIKNYLSFKPGDVGESENENLKQNDPETDIGIEGDASESNHVQQAEKWCSHVLGIQDNDRDCLWFKRLAETYQELRCSDEAIENFKKVDAMAQGDENTETAIRISALISLAALEPDAAVEHSTNALELDRHSADARYSLFSIYCLKNEKNKAQDLVIDTAQLTLSGDGPSDLKGVIEKAARNDAIDHMSRLFETIIVASAQDPDHFRQLLSDMDGAAHDSRNQIRYYELANLLLYRGIALAHYDCTEHADAATVAVRHWQEAASVIIEKLSTHSGQAKLLGAVNRQLSFHYFQLQSPNSAKSLWDVLQSQKNIIMEMSPAKAYLVAHYRRESSESQKAKELLRPHVEMALRLLSDNTTDNDWQGYLLLSRVYLYWGREDFGKYGYILRPQEILNEDALSQWFRYNEISEELVTGILGFYSERPSDQPLLNQIDFLLDRLYDSDTESNREARRAVRDYWNSIVDGYLEYYCDSCGCRLSEGNAMFMCKFCFDMGFCEPCKNKIQGREIKTHKCHAEHEWVKLGIWNTEQQIQAVKKRFKLEGPLGDYGDVGDEVSAVQWLNYLRDTWEFSEDAFKFE
ncbi:uncharacterized protein BDW47DRAFT_91583 [Aspergillus candidus]|uniref:Uncharacterized protein n=1 Tax=Aspergillus candidus TaxID=41067 RepID=A0A2I2EYU9_ASPCN|nr:hypothetical protein BDW47DRAFT_91583 [Aspergillus candidus]PLB33556.1 hypothetical protein BDW47DRAFT_91583 [Aspergillus candidus]